VGHDDPRPGEAPPGPRTGGGAGSDETLVEVRILSFPIDLYQRAREHSEGLMREFTLIRLSEPDSLAVPNRLVEVADELTQRFAAFTAVPESQLAEAEARGDEQIDLLYCVPPDAADAAVRYGALLDEADDYCRSGEHLLTLVTPPDLLGLRRWFFEEIVGQAAGKAPTSWPEWQQAATRTAAGAAGPRPRGAEHGGLAGGQGEKPESG